MNPKKISRICWNTNDWVKPSGKEGKSKTKDKDGNYVFEWEYGYGHEEWLFDMDKLINGYHYGFLETINKYRDKYIDEIYDISLYTINFSTKEKYWIGEIKNVYVLNNDEATSIYAIYKRKRWFNEMLNDVKVVGGKVNKLKNIEPNNFVNIRFTKNDLFLLPQPELIDKKDRAIKAYYYTLLNKNAEPVLKERFDGIFNFKPGFNNNKKTSTYKSYRRYSKSVKLEHNKIQKQLYNCLCRQYGSKNVGTENSTGYGSRVDVVVKKDKVIFYELKTGPNILSNIREALTQLMEYAYFPGREIADEIVIVSLVPTKPKIEKYLSTLRTKFKIPVYYQKFDTEKRILI